MKTLTIGSIFVLLAIGSGALAQSAFADHSEVAVDMPEGTSSVGCQDTDKCFIPTHVTVDVGGSVTWTNSDTAGHVVESGTISDGPSDVFGTGFSLVPPGDAYTFKFDDVESGTYPYFCMVHPWMAGTVTVVAAGEDGKDKPDTTSNDTTIPPDDDVPPPENGGCLIATAAFGSELAPQVQQLREIRDSMILQTESGAAFMDAFNRFYYSFSPGVADLERQSPAFKETVKAAITPMLASLSILSYAPIDSEVEMLGYGIGIILLNIGMYVGVPAAAVLWLARRRTRGRRLATF